MSRAGRSSPSDKTTETAQGTKQMETIHGFKYCGYWIEYQSPENKGGAVWVYESTSEFDNPTPVKSLPSAEAAVAWIERGWWMF